MSQEFQDYIDSKGVECALAEDCCKAMLLFASDKTINGESWAPWTCGLSDRLLEIGRALGAVPRSQTPEGIMDLELDDWPKGSTYGGWQDIVMDIAGNTAVHVSDTGDGYMVDVWTR